MTDPSDLARRNQRVMMFAVVFVMMMVGLCFAAVPLYRAFCQLTGLGGTTQTSSNAPQKIPANTRKITIRFDADVDSKLPWKFGPEQTTFDVLIGQTGMASYLAQNLSDTLTTGVAIHNVTPLKAGKYFVKTQCFCFNNQPLAAHASAHMPLIFYIDPKMLADPNMHDVQEITLSYRFYPAGSAALEKATQAIQNE